ncbi:MAG TPA: hypothetical protein VK671_11485 [Mucilaginibacter sp.]|nr:hypothetical protein [Mucilaginibacter sp.]
MGIDEFNRRMIEIEAANQDVFKGRRVFSYFELDSYKSTGTYIIDIDPAKRLPQNVRDEIQKAFDKFLVKRS